MGEASNRAKARTTEIKARSAEELKQRGTELRTKGTELRTRGGELARQYASMDVSWARCGYARAAREGILRFILGPMIDIYTRRPIVQRDVFDDLPSPVIFVANHSSHLDTPMILRALPLPWRQRTAVAAAADYFYKSRAVANAVALIFNTVPMLRRGGGGAGSGAFDHIDRLIDGRWNLLIYPEGTRSRDGRVGRLRSGAAVIAQQHQIPIVPIHVRGTHDAMPPGRNWPKRVRGFLSRRHRVEIEFGPAIHSAAGEDPSAMMERVRRHLEPDQPLQVAEGFVAAAALREPVKPGA
jgi:1-acyl-sn-glycerol-3-phosphate acyltransferase